MAYNWNYRTVGGVTRAYITNGEDIAHLGELDKKMWTVLSCPAKGLEIDSRTLEYIDSNHDGTIRVDEVIADANWLTKVLKNNDVLLQGADSLALDQINPETPEGQSILAAAQNILKQLGKADAGVISLAEGSAARDSFIASKLEAAKAAVADIEAVEAPYGGSTDAVEAAYNKMNVRVMDHFRRAKLPEFVVKGDAAFEVQTDEVDAFATIHDAIEGKELTEALWLEIGAKIKAFRDYQAKTTVTEASIAIDEENSQIQAVDKLLHLVRDFCTLLRNYVSFQDFYSKDTKAIFQAGTLIIDQRSCDMCMLVNDPGALAAQAPKSNMYLLTCDCVSKSTGKNLKIVAAITVGDVDNLFVGKNAIFYDRAGVDYDAKVTAIIDNPISIGQAMWSPYKKFGKLVEEQINKFASSKESAVSADISSAATKTVDSTTSAAATPAEGEPAPKDAGKAAASGFDIAKFCGIFAAIGMALGYIGSFLVQIASGFLALKWWQMPLSILAIMLLISAPSMFIAWSKLRRRDLAPVLNANGWAVNVGAKINIPFGETLTQKAHIPFSSRVKTSDPYESKHTGRNIFIALLVIAGAVAACWYFGLLNGIISNY